MEKNIMIRFNAEVGEEFFKRCMERGIADDDVDAKIELFAELAREGKPITVMATDRTKEQVIEDMAKRHKILHIKPEDEKEDK